jgi:uridine kinase
MKMNSVENIDKFLNFEKGNYLICGRPVSGTSTLYNQLLVKLKNENDIFLTDLDNSFITTKSNIQYEVHRSTDVSNAKGKNIMNIHLLSNSMENEDDIPNELKEEFLCIYSKYSYTNEPTKDNEKKANINYTLKTFTMDMVQ